jgi:hypothetical protein
MGKTNFTKVEEVLAQGLRKYSVDHLLEMADEAGETRPRNPTITYSGESEKPQTPKLTKEQSLLIGSLQRDAKRYQKKDPEFYTKLGIAKKELKKWIENPGSLTPAEWETIKQIRGKIDEYKLDLSLRPLQQTDESIVESERREHVNRRYNVNKKWLPLT